MIKASSCFVVKPCDPVLTKNLARDLRVSEIFARILINRGFFDAEAANRFLTADIHSIHDPFLLKDMDLAVARLIKAIHLHEKICVYGDYDVDGAVATTMLILFFKELGVAIDHYIPNRMTEGYSMNPQSLLALAGKGVKLVITVDNGVMSHAAVLRAKELGLDVIVTDHHHADAVLPPAVAVVDPLRHDCTYPFKGIAGAGVVFKVLMALRQRLREQGYFKNLPEPNLKQYLDLLVLATICDVVPLKDENRYFVKAGLEQLRKTARPGLKALIKVSGLTAPVTTHDVGFKLGPRINACGRLQHADLGVQLLLTDDDGVAIKNATCLDFLNRERQALELEIVSTVLERVATEVDLERTLGLVLYDPDWHVGVVGIVASRVVERFGRPVFILCKGEQGEIKGSGRSIAGVSLVEALAECGKHLIKYGGHEAAAGVTLKEEKLLDFKAAFDEAVGLQMNITDTQPVIRVDDDLTGVPLDWTLMKELARLEPHGMGNARPVFVVKGLKVRHKRLVGKGHVKLTVFNGFQDMDAIAFNRGSDFEAIGDVMNAVVGLEVNRFNDIDSIQMVVKEIFDAPC